MIYSFNVYRIFIILLFIILLYYPFYHIFLIVYRVIIFYKNQSWKMETLQMFGLLDQENDSWFMNHKPLIPALPYTVILLFFVLFLDQLLEALSRGQPHPLVVINCVLLILTQRSLGALWWGWVPKLGRAPSRIEPGTFWY